MYRHSPSRHQKAKGFRLKHVLQICVLVGVCFWLIYQVKHSHDKRKQFDENDAKTSRDVEMNSAVLKLGRKDLISQEKGPIKDLESHDEEVEEEIVEEDKSEEENGEQDKNEEEIGEEDKHGEEIEKEDKHEEESEEEEKHEEETAEEDKNEEETEEGKKEEESGEEDKHDEENGEEDKHEEENGEEDKHEEETGIEDEHENEEQEEDIETEEKGDRGGDVGVNEQEQEKTDSNVNQEEEFLDEEKDNKDTNEKETEDKDDGGKDSQHTSIEDHDHDEGARNTREAREEQYKGDDASSAVTHDGQITSTENVIGSMENQASTVEHNNKHDNTEEGGAGKNTTDVNLNELEAGRNGSISSNEEKSSEVLDSVSRSNSSFTSITALESNGQSEIINITDTQDSSVKNEIAVIKSDSNSGSDGNETAAQGTNSETLVLEQSDKSTVSLDNAKLDSNSSSSTANVEENPVESRDSSTNFKFVSAETLAQSNVSAENKDGSASSTIVESTNDGNENPENVEGTEGTYDNSDSSNTDDTDQVQHDSIDSSDISLPVDDKENRIDLDTLPEIRTEGSNSEEVAEE